MSTNWIGEFLVAAVERKVCTMYWCSTCGCRKLRQGVRDALTVATGQRVARVPGRINPEAAAAIATALAAVTHETAIRGRLERAVRLVLLDLWLGVPEWHDEIRRLLGGTWAGSVLKRMEDHYHEREAARRYNDPANVRKRREERLQRNQERHQQRLALKKDRDLLRREKHRGGIR